MEKPKIKSKNPDEWTVMLYFCADTRESEVTSSIDNSGNFLHADMYAAMNSIPSDLAVGSDAEINFIALYDYPYSTGYPDGHALIYDITQAGGVSPVVDWGATNMGDDVTLSDFVSYCKTNYPATNYALVLSDHGRAYAGFCYDYHAPHPYWAYSLGDCLTVPEVETALSGGNNVDVIFFDTCSGGSFEAAWQFAGEADYMVAGETLQSGDALHHPREIAYALSRDTDMTPLELAQAGFDGAVSPTVLPSSYDWSSVSLYDLTAFDDGSPSFITNFMELTLSLCNEINNNVSMRSYFIDLRSNMMVSGLSTKGMLVDLYDFLETLVANEDDLYYNATSDFASDLMVMLDSGTNIIVDEWHAYAGYTNLHGYSLCFPDSYDMYKGYMYPNMYEDLKISSESDWYRFIKKLFPTYDLDHFRIPEQYRLFVHPLDPVIQLHIFFDSTRYQKMLHVGLNDEFYNEPGMGIELGIPNSEFYDDLWGNSMISIPTANLNQLSGKANGVDTFKVVINASAATTPDQEVNFVVKHILNDATVWDENMTLTVQPGQVLTTQVSTNDTMTTIIDEAPPVTTTPPTTTPPETTTPTDTGTGQGIVQFFQDNWLWFAIGGGGVVLLIIIITIAASTRKQKKKKGSKRIK